MRISHDILYPLIARAAADTGLAWWLLYSQIEQESGFDPNAVSSCGALGLLQLMPSTFPHFTRQQLLDPETNLRLGSRYLAELRDTFQHEDVKERLRFALAAYNGGLGAVLHAQALALRRGLNPACWDDLACVFPEVRQFYAGAWHTPDYRQILDYVARIWRNFQARASQPVPALPADARLASSIPPASVSGAAAATIPRNTRNS